MHILLSGASGFLGSHLVSFFDALGHRVSRLVRHRPILRSEEEFFWDPSSGELDLRGLERVDAVIHLSGAGVAEKAWTDEYKRRLYRSRVLSTETLVQGLSYLAHPPRVFICASAVGYYGDRADELLNEESAVGNGFLAALCTAWEQASLCKNGNIRVVNTRFGMILDKNGGFLQKILPIFRFGLGGNLGSGEQYVSWIALEDVMRAMLHVIENEKISGPVNCVAPHPIKNKEFTKILAKNLHRPAFFHVSAFVLRAMFGKEKAQELFLSSCRAIPEKLLFNDFHFKHQYLEQALNEIL